ncbi:hypothetical protein SISSUDRAFT_959411, partial [Sistotremastrum suecicum HHB10207 ss-3]
PARPLLDSKKILDYAYLGEFELLRESPNGILEKPWAQPVARETSVLHFKLLRAEEEVVRLNIELKRLKTFMVEEEAFLGNEFDRIAPENPPLGFQLLRRLSRLTYINGMHWDVIARIEAMDGFTG